MKKKKSQSLLSQLSINLKNDRLVWSESVKVRYSPEEFIQRVPKAFQPELLTLLSELGATVVERGADAATTFYRAKTSIKEGKLELNLLIKIDEKTVKVRPFCLMSKTSVEFYIADNLQLWLPTLNVDDVKDEFDEFVTGVALMRGQICPEVITLRACFIATGCTKVQYEQYIKGEAGNTMAISKAKRYASKLQNQEGFIPQMSYWKTLRFMVKNSLKAFHAPVKEWDEPVLNLRLTVYQYLKSRAYRQKVAADQQNL